MAADELDDQSVGPRRDYASLRFCFASVWKHLARHSVTPSYPTITAWHAGQAAGMWVYRERRSVMQPLGYKSGRPQLPACLRAER